MSTTFTNHPNGDVSFDVQGHDLRVAWSERGKTYHTDGWDLADIPLYLDGKKFSAYAMAVNQESGNDVLYGSRLEAEEYLRHATH